MLKLFLQHTQGYKNEPNKLPKISPHHLEVFDIPYDNIKYVIQAQQNLL